MNRVKSERSLVGMRQTELALTLGVAPSTVGRWEDGGSIPQDKLLAMRGLFCCDIDWLLGASDTRQTTLPEDPPEH